jgi:D-alanyl-D-alanine carboxypeptidase
VIHRLPGLRRPCTRIIVFRTPATVKQAQLSAHWIWLLVAGMAGFLCGFGPPRLVDREIGPTERVSVGELRAWAEQSPVPLLTAQSYLLYDMQSGATLFEHNSHSTRAPASLTKLMTVLLVFERANLNDIVTIEEQDLENIDPLGTMMGLAVGDSVSVTDLLWGALLPSGNDAATALARYVGGSVENFVAAMNPRAQALGLHETHFVNSHGLDANEHLSSAADLLVVTRELWAYPLFHSMVGTARAVWNGRDLVNTNELLTTFDGATGVKTGTTDNAGQCLVASIERDGHTVLMVIMGSTDRYTDAANLYNAFQNSYRWGAVDGHDLAVFNRMHDSSGQLWFVQPTGPQPVVLQHWPGVPVIRSYRRLQITPGEALAPGTQVGVLEWWAGQTMVGSQNLVIR